MRVLLNWLVKVICDSECAIKAVIFLDGRRIPPDN